MAPPRAGSAPISRIFTILLQNSSIRDARVIVETHRRHYKRAQVRRLSSTAWVWMDGSCMRETVIDEYKPSERESFMNERQKEYFRRKLWRWRDDILRESRETLNQLQTEREHLPDLADRASTETDRSIELRARDRQRKLIAKIDAALSRIEDGTYGYCDETGEPISLKRLEARPIATLSIEAQERHERAERVHRDD